MEEKWMQIAVLDYNNGQVASYENCFPTDKDGNVQSEAVEKFLCETCGFNIDEISYMFAEQIEWV